MKTYVDSDVILDVLLGREVFLIESSQILNLCETHEITGCTTTLAIANIYYILTRYDSNSAKTAIKSLREILQVLPVTDEDIGKSLHSKFKDFEDGVQNFVAENHACNCIITRNKKRLCS
ncbi:PIN domain-containing protein [Ghiorsea bivora]|uniref:PIN domain-containing protein n=1 Tax=Ghiorsea bivora TaxID=1485545 RepID=UPI00068F5EA4|nr:PIN domain-containing protein [Ghiorsea bivora]